jgi:hypothetical protein
VRKDGADGEAAGTLFSRSSHDSFALMSRSPPSAGAKLTLISLSKEAHRRVPSPGLANPGCRHVVLHGGSPCGCVLIQYHAAGDYTSLLDINLFVGNGGSIQKKTTPARAASSALLPACIMLVDTLAHTNDQPSMEILVVQLAKQPLGRASAPKTILTSRLP